MSNLLNSGKSYLSPATGGPMSFKQAGSSKGGAEQSQGDMAAPQPPLDLPAPAPMPDIASEMANTTGPSINNPTGFSPMGFSPNLGAFGRGITGGKGGAS